MAEVFTPGAPTQAIIDFIEGAVGVAGVNFTVQTVQLMA